ncbi:hypothetical protein LJC72_13750, partial [Bacteroides sp. OttesenSCG-928-D19]|nr:hypothetical protein [Bacteroides sp. OttesenSCG-928-D19]
YFVNKIKGLIKFFEPSFEGSINKNGIRLKNDLAYRQVLLDQILEEFKKRFEEETTIVSISYPVSFAVYFHPDDYILREGNFGRDVIDAVTLFYKHINKNLANPANSYQPDYPYWSFQFINSQGSFVVDNIGNEMEIEKGTVAILSDVRTNDFSDNVQSSNTIKSTFRAKDSAKQFALNNESLIAMLNKSPNQKWGLKYFDDDRRLEKVTGKPANPDATQNAEEALAILRCDDKFVGKNGKGEKFYMYDKMIEISNKDAQVSNQIARVDKNNLENPHVIIKYISEIKMFQLAAFGNTKLNERPVKISQGGDIHWENLSNNSDILINNEIGIVFNKI